MRVALELVPLTNNVFAISYILNWNMEDDLIYSHESDSILIDKLNEEPIEAIIEREKITIDEDMVNALLDATFYKEIKTRTKLYRIPDLEKMGLVHE